MTHFAGSGSVLVGVDGSTDSNTAVGWAAAYAAAHRRPLTLVHGAGAPVETEMPFDLEEARQALMAAGQSVIDRGRCLALAVSPRLDIREPLEAGDPRPLLVDEAAEGYLLVVGSRGHGASPNLLLGSVSMALAAHVTCPVVVVRTAQPEDSSGPVVVGVDGAQDSSDALTFAFELADDQRRPLEIVHAAGESWLFPAPDAAPAEDITADWELLMAESVAGYAEKFPDVVVTTRVAQGSAAAALVVASRYVAIVVVGERGGSALSRRLVGSMSRSVLEHAACTVAVVRNVKT
jgi:nucleotide-binding universal stress UspA family protein